MFEGAFAPNHWAALFDRYGDLVTEEYLVLRARAECIKYETRGHMPPNTSTHYGHDFAIILYVQYLLHHAHAHAPYYTND